MSNYPDVLLHIAGSWREAEGSARLEVLNPATGMSIGHAAHAQPADIDAAAEACTVGFAAWRVVPPFDRGRVLRRAADLLRSRADMIAPLMTLEQGKPLADARAEAIGAADFIEWCAEEGMRIYGRVIAPRTPGILQIVRREPVGPVAAFTPWNFPILQAVRKIGVALAAGCAIVIKGPEETPASCAELIRAFADAGLPSGAINLLYGTPAEISGRLIANPIIRKISFTGSTQVGKQLAMTAGQHMKRATMELGGHAPAIVFADADLPHAMRVLSENKFRNAGQICVSPTRFLVEDAVYDRFVEGFVAAAQAVRVGDGQHAETQMGPLANARRIDAMQHLVQDATAKGATVRTGGRRRGNTGFFFEPTVLTEVTTDMAIMNEEPFGPIAPIMRFKGTAAAIAEGNRLPFGLSAYVYTRSSARANEVAEALESGIVSVNQHARSVPEAPFGGVKDSGYGSEGGPEAFEAYLTTKLISQVGLA